MKIRKIIPCLDIDGGRVVKGINFVGIKDAGDPAEFARRYNDSGADELAMLDISATTSNRATLLDVVRAVAAEISIPLCVGGGIRGVEDMRATIAAGASKVSVCSAALSRPDLLAEMAAEFGSPRVVLALDAKRISRAGEVMRWNAFSRGGTFDTGVDAIEWAKKAVELGAGEIILTSIDTDGTGGGYDIELCDAVAKAVPVPVTASGGAGSLEQVAEVLEKTDVAAALVASLVHFGKATIPEIKAHLKTKGICVL
ncbi:MAG: imidazole glycerol phosphate synthase cyclase subunit [Treponema sp.]|nr:imidazole glycerol phosphate synthase cyclase subunit [Treponema sp.]